MPGAELLNSVGIALERPEAEFGGGSRKKTFFPTASAHVAHGFILAALPASKRYETGSISFRRFLTPNLRKTELSGHGKKRGSSDCKSITCNWYC